ncbi:MAG: hypothetical protein AAF728_04765 [Cyanobacteria bacterium P01_D01_bin.128]
MESVSQSDKPPEHLSSRVAVVVGVAIALATVVLPIFAIARFSPARVPPIDSSRYLILHVEASEPPV